MSVYIYNANLQKIPEKAKTLKILISIKPRNTACLPISE